MRASQNSKPFRCRFPDADLRGSSASPSRREIFPSSISRFLVRGCACVVHRSGGRRAAGNHDQRRRQRNPHLQPPAVSGAWRQPPGGTASQLPDAAGSETSAMTGCCSDKAGLPKNGRPSSPSPSRRAIETSRGMSPSRIRYGHRSSSASITAETIPQKRSGRLSLETNTGKRAMKPSRPGPGQPVRQGPSPPCRAPERRVELGGLVRSSSPITAALPSTG